MGKVSTLVAACLLLIAAGAFAQFPPAGIDNYAGNHGMMQLEVLGISPIESVDLSGPVSVNRSNPVDPGDGRPVIETEIIGLNLTGVAPIAGPVNMILQAAPSKGQIKANAAVSDFPATSFFDILAQVDLPGSGLSLTNRSPLTVNGQLTSIPWPGQSHSTSPTLVVDLYDASGAVRAKIYYFDWTPNFPCPPGPPFCDSTVADQCLLICPKSDITYRVQLKDSCGNPVCDMNGTWLDFSQCPVIPCANEEPNWPKVFPDSCNPATGIHYFTVDASLVGCTTCDAALFVKNAFCRIVKPRFLDNNGDHCVTDADFIVGAICSDFNCDGITDALDLDLFIPHKGHCCPSQPCPPGPPFCDSVIADPCLLICPKSDVTYKVIVRDSCGNPVCSPTAGIWLDFGQCPATPCPNEESGWPRVYPDSCNITTGTHYFTVDASLLGCTVCNVALYINGVFCRSVEARFFDTNGDGCVTRIDYMGSPLCNDYNCDGAITTDDLAIFQTHLGHCCSCTCRPGDANGSGSVNVLDVNYLTNFLYRGGPAPVPFALCAGDANCDCKVNILDVTFLINFLYRSGPAPCTCEQWIVNCGAPLRE